MGGGDSCKLLAKAFVYWLVGSIGSYLRRAGTAILRQSLCQLRGVPPEACGKGLPLGLSLLRSPQASPGLSPPGMSWESSVFPGLTQAPHLP